MRKKVLPTRATDQRRCSHQPTHVHGTRGAREAQSSTSEDICGLEGVREAQGHVRFGIIETQNVSAIVATAIAVDGAQKKCYIGLRIFVERVTQLSRCITRCVRQ